MAVIFIHNDDLSNKWEERFIKAKINYYLNSGDLETWNARFDRLIAQLIIVE